jgi:hypothetical protein
MHAVLHVADRGVVVRRPERAHHLQRLGAEPELIDALENRFELQRQPLLQDDVLRKLARHVFLAQELLQREMRRHLRVLVLFGHLDEAGRRRVERIAVERLRWVLTDAIAVEIPVFDFIRGNHDEDVQIDRVLLRRAVDRHLVGAWARRCRVAPFPRALLHGAPVLRGQHVVARRSAHGFDGHRRARQQERGSVFVGRRLAFERDREVRRLAVERVGACRRRQRQRQQRD